MSRISVLTCVIEFDRIKDPVIVYIHYRGTFWIDRHSLIIFLQIKSRIGIKVCIILCLIQCSIMHKGVGAFVRIILEAIIIHTVYCYISCVCTHSVGCYGHK